MQFHCTKKLLDELEDVGISENKDVQKEVDSFFSWHATYNKINRHNVIILVNNISRYAILFYNVKRKHFNNFNDLLENGIRKAFKEEGIRDEIIEKYLSISGPIVFTKTSSNSLLGTINLITTEAYNFEDTFRNDTTEQPEFSYKTSRTIRKINKNYERPIDVLLSNLEGLLDNVANTEDNKKSVLSIRMNRLLIKLDLEKHDIWRRIIVPENITFNKIHKVIIAAFGWFGYHSFDFNILENNKRIAYIGEDEDVLDFSNMMEEPIYIANRVKLKEFSPENYNIVYHYDLGDYWTHNVIFEGYIEDYPVDEVKCMEVHGDTPPEDVGGESGYEEYLDIIKDKSNPRYEEMISFSDFQKVRATSLEEINLCIKRRY